jgi:hypothetical protein
MYENNTYIQQHLFYIGDNVVEQLRTTYSDSLIFDRSRNSIYAQNHEFGYISDYENSIDLRNADGTNKTTITLSVVNGQISLKEYRSVLITAYETKYTCSNTYSGTTYVLGAEVTMNSLNLRISGSEVSDDVKISRIFNNANDIIVSYNDFALAEGYTRKIEFEVSELTKFKSTTPGTFNIANVTVTDPKNAFDSKNISISWQNNVMLYKWSKDNLDFYGLRDFILTKSSISDVTSELGTTTLYNGLTSNYRIGGTTVTCNNGPNEYLALCCPSRLKNSDSFTGILGGAAVQEFKKVKTVSYINNANYNENYNIYLATGHNWNGQSLVLK